MYPEVYDKIGVFASQRRGALTELITEELIRCGPCVLKNITLDTGAARPICGLCHHTKKHP